MAKTKKTSPGEAAAPARRRGTKALDLQPVAWVKVPSPQGVKPGAPVSYLAHYSMNLSTPASREKFMAKVAASMDAF